MASLPRARLSRLLGAALRSRTALSRPFQASRWIRASAASSAAWSGVQNGASGHLTGYERQLRARLVQQRGYSAGSGGMSTADLEEGVLKVLKLFDKVHAEKVTLEAHFINDLGMDSLDAVEVVMAFEDEFGVEISDEEAEKILSCKDAVELLKTKIDVH